MNELYVYIVYNLIFSSEIMNNENFCLSADHLCLDARQTTEGLICPVPA